jgi:hypothetical protein
MKLQIKDFELLSPGGDNYNHIKSVEIFSGNDDYELTEKVLITTDYNEVKIKSKTPLKESFEARIRGEPFVRIHLQEESIGDRLWYADIYHHKGNIQASCFYE